MRFCIWSESETTVKVATLVNVFYCRGNINVVQSIEESKALKGTVYESSIVFCVNGVSPECSCFRILQWYNVYIKKVERENTFDDFFLVDGGECILNGKDLDGGNCVVQMRIMSCMCAKATWCKRLKCSTMEYLLLFDSSGRTWSFRRGQGLPGGLTDITPSGPNTHHSGEDVPSASTRARLSSKQN